MGDVHAHRSMDEMSSVIVAEDLNVGFPTTYWVRDSQEIPSASGPASKESPSQSPPTTSSTLLILNTKSSRSTASDILRAAVLVLNHKRPLNIPAPPALSVAEEARRQGGLLDLEKHSWAWSMMIVPIMNVDLFELSNNHKWQTQFAFSQWTIQNAPKWPEVELSATGFTELGGSFALQTYYSLLNCGFRMRVDAGTGSGVHPVPAGHSRVYVHTGNPFSYEKWIETPERRTQFCDDRPTMNVRFDGDLPGTTWRGPNNKTISQSLALSPASIDSSLLKKRFAMES